MAMSSDGDKRTKRGRSSSRGRSRSSSMDTKNSKRRHRSRSSSLGSYYDDRSWTSRSDKREFRYVSHWKKTDVEGLGLFYDTKNSSVATLFSLAEKRTRKCKVNDLPEITKLLVNICKEFLVFSLKDFGGYQSLVQLEEDLEVVKSGREHFTSCLEDAEKRHAPLLNKGDNRRIIYTWYSRTLEFLFQLPIVMSKKHAEVREADFQFLFMQLSGIFFLTPQIGEACRREMFINGEAVVCKADIRFVCYASPKTLGAPCAVVMIAEIKIKDKRRKSTEDGGGNLDIYSLTNENILGQVGGEMLFESEFSAFFPGVIGILCVGTKIIFLYCEVNDDHMKSIKEHGKPGKDDGERSTIHFTKAFDYMKAEDRNEILQYLFWIGYIQSSDT